MLARREDKLFVAIRVDKTDEEMYGPLSDYDDDDGDEQDDEREDGGGNEDDTVVDIDLATHDETEVGQQPVHTLRN